jgi:hypothetical protein
MRKVSGIKSMNKNKLLMLILVVIVCVTMSVVFLRYPASWNNVEVGMSRDQVLAKMGKSLTDEGYYNKGDVYVHRLPFGWYRMDILTDTSDLVYGKSISLYIGTQEHYCDLNIVANYK